LVFPLLVTPAVPPLHIISSDLPLLLWSDLWFDVFLRKHWFLRLSCGLALVLSQLWFGTGFVSVGVCHWFSLNRTLTQVVLSQFPNCNFVSTLYPNAIQCKLYCLVIFLFCNITNLWNLSWSVKWLEYILSYANIILDYLVG
jgi:hypothetical protein